MTHAHPLKLYDTGRDATIINVFCPIIGRAIRTISQLLRLLLISEQYKTCKVT